MLRDRADKEREAAIRDAVAAKEDEARANSLREQEGVAEGEARRDKCVMLF
jgi:hypothetical protein